MDETDDSAGTGAEHQACAPASAPVDHLRRVRLYFILQEYQVATQEHVQIVDRQQI